MDKTGHLLKTDLPPEDVVSRSRRGVSQEVGDVLESAVGQHVTVHLHGETIEGPDGEMHGMTESRDVTATLARPRLAPIEGDIGDDDDSGAQVAMPHAAVDLAFFAAADHANAASHAVA